MGFCKPLNDLRTANLGPQSQQIDRERRGVNPLWIPLIERHALHYLAVASKLESPMHNPRAQTPVNPNP